jgi:hypothetical protein
MPEQPVNSFLDEISQIGGAPTDLSEEDFLAEMGGVQAGPGPAQLGVAAGLAQNAVAERLADQEPSAIKAPDAAEFVASAGPNFAHPNVASAQKFWRQQGLEVKYTAAQRDQVEELSSRMTWQTLMKMGLATRDGRLSADFSQESVNQLLGAYRHTLVPLLAPMDRDEERQMARQGMERMMEKIEKDAVAKLGSQEAVDPERLQHIASEAREMRSRANDTRVQDLYLYHAGRAMDRVRANAPTQSDLAVRLGLERSLFSEEQDLRRIYDKHIAETNPDAIGPGGGLPQRMEHLVRRAFNDLGDNLAPDQAMASSLQGGLLKLRMGRLGLEGQTADLAGIQAAAMLSNPELAAALSQAATVTQVKLEAGRKISDEVDKAFFKKEVKALDATLPVMLDRALSTGLTPFMALQQLEVGKESVGGALAADSADRAMQVLGSWIQKGADTVGAARELVGSIAPDDPKRHLYGGVIANMGVATATKAAYDRIQRAEAEFEQLHATIRGSIAEAPAGVARATVLAEGQSLLRGKQDEIWYLYEGLFNPEGSATASAGLLLGFEDAQRIMDEFGTSGLTGQTLGQMVKASVRERISRPKGFSRAELEQSNQRIANLMKRTNGFDSDMLKLTDEIADNAVLRVGADIRGMFEMFVSDPEEATNLAGVMAGLTAIGPLNRFRRDTMALARKGMFARDASKVVGAAARADSGMTDRIIRQLREQGLDSEDHLRNAVANLETMQQLHRRTPGDILEPTGDPNARIHEFNAAQRSFERQARKLGPENLTEILEGLGVDQLTMDRLMHSGYIRNIVGRVGDTLKLSRAKVPTFNAKQSVPIAGQIVDAVDRGVNLPAWGELPISFEGLAAVGGRARVNLRQFISEHFPKLVPALTEGALPKQVARFYSNFADTVSSWRGLVAERLTRIEDFYSTHINKRVQRLKELHTVGRATDNPALIAARDAEASKVQAIVQQRTDLTRRTWDERIDVTKMDFWKEDVTAAEAWQWARATHGVNDLHYHLGLADEGIDAFKARISEALLNPAEAAKLKNTLGKTYLESPGMRDVIDIDPETGQAFLPHQANRIKKENARRIAAAPDPDDVDLIPIIPRAGVKAELNALRAAARTERAALGGKTSQRMLVRAQDLDLQPRLLAQQTSDFKYQLQIHAMATQHLKAAGDRAYAAMTDTQRAAYNEALGLWQRRGRITDLETLRRDFPEMMRQCPVSDDAAVQALLDHSENFHKHLVDMLDDASGKGPRFQATRDYYLGPYVPQKYMLYESQNLLPQAVETAPVERLISPGGADRSFTEASRNIDRFKARVDMRGGSPITKSFDTAEAAEAWVRERFGGKLSSRETTRTAGLDAEDIEGVTPGGDRATILAPLGAERAAQLQLLKPGEGLSIRFKEMLDSATTQRFIQTLDRPGWTYTLDDWNKFIQTPEGSKAATTGLFQRMPDKPDAFGPLAGKFVHKDLVGALSDFTDHLTGIDAVAAAARSYAESTSVFAELLSKGRRGLGNLAANTKRMLVQNRIARNAKVVAHNLFGDSLLFAPTAVGHAYNFSLAGWKAKGQAFADLWRFTMRGELPDDPVFREALEDGALDDFAVIGQIDPKVRAASNDVLFSSDDVLPADMRAVLRSYGVSPGGSPMTFRGAAEASLGMGGRSPRFKKLQADLDKVERTLANPSKLSEVEINKLINQKEALSKALTADYHKAFGRTIGRGTQAVSSWLMGAPTGLLKDRARFSSQFYNLVNNFNRMAAYRYARQTRGWSREFTMERLNTFMQTFSRVPRSVRQFSKHPLANPVISFPYEAARIGTNMALHNWPALAAWTMGVPAANMALMAFGGVDPFEAYETMKNQSGQGAAGLLTSLIVPRGDGTFDTAMLPAMTPLMWARTRSDPLMSGVIAENEEPANLLDAVSSELLETTFATFFGNPLTTAAISIGAMRDPSNGRPVDNRFEAAGLSAQKYLESIVPAETPFIGSIHNQLINNIERPPNALSERRVALGQRAIQAATGLSLRGQLADGRLADNFGRAMLSATGGAGGRPIPLDVEQGLSFGADDLVVSLYWQAKNEYRDNRTPQRAAADEAFNLFRLAQDFERKGDTASAKELRGKAQKIMREKINDEDATILFEPGRSGEPFTMAEFNALQRAKRSFNFDDNFQSASPRVQAYVIANASRFDSVPEAQVRSLAMLSIMQTRRAALRNKSDIDSLKLAGADLEDFIAKNPDNPNLPVLSQLRAVMRVQLLKAEVRFLKSQGPDRVRAESVRQLRELETTP